MNSRYDSKLAQALGQRMMRHEGAKVLELIYYLEEPSLYEAMRAILLLSEKNQRRMIEFLNNTNPAGSGTLVMKKGHIQV